MGIDCSVFAQCAKRWKESFPAKTSSVRLVVYSIQAIYTLYSFGDNIYFITTHFLQKCGVTASSSFKEESFSRTNSLHSPSICFLPTKNPFLISPRAFRGTTKRRSGFPKRLFAYSLKCRSQRIRLHLLHKCAESGRNRVRPANLRWSFPHKRR